MAKNTYGAEEARSLLPELLERARQGKTSIITKRGKPFAALVPVEQGTARKLRTPLLALEGSGEGLWGSDSASSVARMRDEWE